MKPQGNSTWLRIVLTEGKNREIRRMLAKLGHKVMRLKRIAIGPVKLDKLPKGKARRASESRSSRNCEEVRRRREREDRRKPDRRQQRGQKTSRDRRKAHRVSRSEQRPVATCVECSTALARVIEHVPLAERTFRIRLECPRLAAAIRPGQFVMLRLPDTTDPLLGRPFALYDTVLDAAGKPVGVDVVYLVVGKMTGGWRKSRPANASRSGARSATASSIVGTSGARRRSSPAASARRRFSPTPANCSAPAATAATRRASGPRKSRSTTACAPRRSGGRRRGLPRAGAEVHLASDDGSSAPRASSRNCSASHGKTGPLVGCGPEPMLHALASSRRTGACRARCRWKRRWPAASGICFSCVTKVKTPDGWDYKRVCVEGRCLTRITGVE